jgi:perosamine synthetase
LPLIEDAACAFGHRSGGKAAGSFGTMSTLSFSVPKVLTTGQGGAVLTDSQALADRALEYIDHGDLRWRETNLNRGIGTNLRFNDILAALGSAQMRSIERRLARKRSVYLRLRALLGSCLYAVPDGEAPLHNIVFTKEPDRLVAHLRGQDIAAVRQYRSLYQHPPYAYLYDAKFANSDFWTDYAVYLPFGLALTEDDGERIGTAVKASKIFLMRSGDA